MDNQDENAAEELTTVEADEVAATSSNRGALSAYVARVKRHPLLTKEQENEIARRAIAGDKKAGNKLVESNLRLVIKIAHTYKGTIDNLNDLIQEGNVGLVEAVSRFDPDRGYRFTTYAGYWIHSMMLRHIFNNSHMIKPGTTNDQRKLFYNLRKEQQKLSDLGIDADPALIAKNLNVSEEDVVEMDVRLKGDIYLDAPLGGHSSNMNNEKTACDFLCTTPDSQPDNVSEATSFKVALQESLNKFAAKLEDAREKAIYFERLMAETPLTLEQIGDKFSLTKERIRQIEARLILSLKNHLKELAHQ